MLFQEIKSEWGAITKKMVDEQLMPLSKEVDRAGRYDHRLMEYIIKAGLIAPTIAKEYGGIGLNERDLNEVVREIARASTSAASMVTCQLMAAYGLLSPDGASEEQKQRLLPKMASGELIACPAITEDHAGSDVGGISTVAVKKGDHYVLNGEKALISHLGAADFFLVFAKTDPDKGNKGITAFVVYTDNPGLTQGKPLRKMGQRGLDTGSLYLKDCIVPESDRIGLEGKGMRICMALLNRSRLVMGSQAIGTATCAYEAAVDYAKKRMAFGKPLIAQQVIAFKLADMAIKLQTAQTSVNYAADKVDSGATDFIFEVSASKVYASEMARDVINDAVQIHGGIGYTDEHPVERCYRDQRVMEIYGGATEVVKLVISRIISGESKVR